MEEAEAAGNRHFSHFGEAANLLDELEAVFAAYAAGRPWPYPPLRP